MSELNLCDLCNYDEATGDYQRDLPAGFTPEEPIHCCDACRAKLVKRQAEREAGK